jgi:hypothetical protein
MVPPEEKTRQECQDDPLQNRLEPLGHGMSGHVRAFTRRVPEVRRSRHRLRLTLIPVGGWYGSPHQRTETTGATKGWHLPGGRSLAIGADEVAIGRSLRPAHLWTGSAVARTGLDGIANILEVGRRHWFTPDHAVQACQASQSFFTEHKLFSIFAHHSPPRIRLMYTRQTITGLRDLLKSSGSTVRRPGGLAGGLPATSPRLSLLDHRGIEAPGCRVSRIFLRILAPARGKKSAACGMFQPFRGRKWKLCRVMVVFYRVMAPVRGRKFGIYRLMVGICRKFRTFCRMPAPADGKISSECREKPSRRGAPASASLLERQALFQITGEVQHVLLAGRGRLHQLTHPGFLQ